METNEKLLKDRESCIDGSVNKEEILNANADDTVPEELNIDADNSQQSDIVESDNDNLVKESKILFKKPVFIGPKRGKIHVAQDPKQTIVNEKVSGSNKIVEDNEDQNTESRIQHVSESMRDISLPYTEPPWSGRPGKQYKLEVLKSGLILETIDLSERSFHVVGRLPSCNISLAHPNISRYHAVFQYRAQSDENNSIGLYVYDLGSTHGTFWNGNRIKPKIYVRLHAGHMIRFGCSQRKFIVQAPVEDQEEESEFSVTELKAKRMVELRERERMQEELAQNTEDLRKEKDNEDQGIDWGMGEDADEETDMTENPYATTNDEEFFLTDPKKTLRGWFEREGYDLQYQTEQKGIGQFLCWVELPIEGVVGQSIKAEVVVKGKKKEAVIQCALEACRILDRHGLLRQANHEGRKRKARNWEEEDYYDSDEDNFLDRTGTIEKKREQRMRLAGKLEAKVETYSSLLEKHKHVVQQIAHLENCIQNSKKLKNKEADNTNEDALDAFMSTLSSSAASKGDIIKMKLELQNLKKEESKLIDLVNLAKPADLPPLTVKAIGGNESDSRDKLSKNLQNVTQKKKLQTTINNEGMEKPKSIAHSPIPSSNTDETEEVESEDEEIETSHELNPADKQNSSKQCRSTQNQRKFEMDTDMEQEPNNKVSKNIELRRSVSSENNKTESVGSVKDSKDYNEKKKHSKRIDLKGKKQNEKNVKDKLRLDMYKEDYSMWVPPENQTGDGKTNLNDKYGY